MGVRPVFLPLARGTKPEDRLKLDITIPWQGDTLRFRGPGILDIADQGFLLSVLEIAQTHRQDAKLAAATAPANAMRDWLEHRSRQLPTEHLLVRTTFRAIYRQAHPDETIGGKSIALVRASLERLTETTVWQTQGKCKTSSRLLVWRIADDEAIELAVNWRLVAAVLGEKPYATVDLEERVTLGSDLAQALHFMFSCQMPTGSARQYSVETLRSLYFPESEHCPIADDTKCQQRRRLLMAVRQMVDRRCASVTARSRAFKVAVDELLEADQVGFERFDGILVAVDALAVHLDQREDAGVVA